jgi:hypothetical protein
MIALKIALTRLFFRLLKKTPDQMEVVQYWKHGEAAPAKVMDTNGFTSMRIAGEKYQFPGFPRGYILNGKLSKLKHELKNRVFNEAWAKLENSEPEIDIMAYIRKEALPEVWTWLENVQYDVIPPERLVPPVKEIYRAWTKVSPESHKLRDLVVFILQEDDAYRFRFQWMVGFMPTWAFWFSNPIPWFDKALGWAEIAEVTGDMKERERLIRRVMAMILRDPASKRRFKRLFREIRWNKVKMSKADKFFFRAKYFKVDLDKFSY